MKTVKRLTGSYPARRDKPAWRAGFLGGMCLIALLSPLFLGSLTPRNEGTQDPSMAAATQEPMATATIDRLAEPVIPENPTEIDIGRNLYFHHCMPCHGDRGQGLTDEFREIWVEDHQNCWASGCHAGRSIEDAFPIPKSIPALTGDTAIFVRFPQAEDLSEYLSQEHPPQRPGTLTPEECQALTAFIWAENGRDSGGKEAGMQGSLSKAAPYLLFMGVSIGLSLGGIAVWRVLARSKMEKADPG